VITDGLLSPTHLLVILIVALLVFGPKRLPELGKSLGSGMRGFREALSGGHDEGEPAQLEPAASERLSAGEHTADATAKTTNSSGVG
jgi:sec-independent protein translocase protein TatA